jgi:hypothetical protein
MNIFYVSVIEWHAGWGAEWFVNKGFNAIGQTTYCVDYRKYRYRLKRHFLDAPQCDVFFLQRGDGFPLPYLRALQIPRLFWASELVSRCRDQDRLFKSGLFDHVFLRTPQCIETVVSRGWLQPQQCSVLLSGFDESVHRPIPHVERDIDVLFVGSVTPRRQRVLDELQKHHSILVASAFGEELVYLFSRAKVVLNIHAEEYLDTETRVFETLGCGAFLLSERLSVENPFSDRELVQFDSVEELHVKIQYFLSHESERETIAAQGYAAATSGHTYTQRARHITGVMSACLETRGHGTGSEAMMHYDAALRAYMALEPVLRTGDKVLRKARSTASKARGSMKRVINGARR